MAKRLLALIGAVAMVVAAFAFRSSKDGGPDRGSGRTAADGAVVCAQELGPVCDTLPGATIESARVTADRLVDARSAAEADLGAWVVAGPWPAMVDAVRSSTGKEPLFVAPRVLATTRLVTVVRKGQAPAGCAAASTWRCLGDAAQAPAFRLAGDPPTEAGHLFIRAAALGGFLGSTDYASNDLDEVADAAGWLANVDASLDRAPSFGAGSLSRYLSTRGASAQVFVTTEAAARAAGQLADFDVVAPNPPATLLVSVAPTSDDLDLDVDEVVNALTANGWRAAPVPADDGLPSPGVLVALRGRTE